MNNRIEHLSDQLDGYTGEVVRTIDGVSRKYTINDEVITTDQAIKIVDIATRDMLVDALHHLPDDLGNNLNNGLGEISEALRTISENI